VFPKEFQKVPTPDEISTPGSKAMSMKILVS
jgi:hypothetical protein